MYIYIYIRCIYIYCIYITYIYIYIHIILLFNVYVDIHSLYITILYIIISSWGSTRRCEFIRLSLGLFQFVPGLLVQTHRKTAVGFHTGRAWFQPAQQEHLGLLSATWGCSQRSSWLNLNCTRQLRRKDRGETG